jgi:hypothetical protein
MKYLIFIHQNSGARDQFAPFTPTMQAAGLAAYRKLNADLATPRRPALRWTELTLPTKPHDSGACCSPWSGPIPR